MRKMRQTVVRERRKITSPNHSKGAIYRTNYYTLISS